MDRFRYKAKGLLIPEGEETGKIVKVAAGKAIVTLPLKVQSPNDKRKKRCRGEHGASCRNE